MAGKGDSSMPGYETMLGAWLNSAAAYWDTLMRLGVPKAAPGQQETQQGGQSDSGPQETFAELLKMWRSMTAFGTADSETMGSGMSNVSDTFAKAAQSFWEGQLQFLQQWMEGAATGREGKESPERMARAALQAWMNVYEQEYSRLFNVPQLGLTRVYQERASRALDSFNRFQGAFGELFLTLLEPMEKSMEQVQEKVEAMQEEEGQVSLHDQYKMWIKYMEGHYMTMYQSEEYNRIMNRALEAYEAFAADRKEVMEDMLKGLPVPTQREMDDLYRELYELKKRLRKYEREASKP